MAQEIEVKVKVTTDQAEQGLNKLTTGIKGATNSSKELNSTLSGSKQSEFINQLGDGVGKLNPAFGSAVKGANGLILKMWEMVANPVGAVLAGIVVTAKFLYEAFEDSVAGGKELKASFAGLSAVGAEVKSAMFGLGRALIDLTSASYKFITLDFKGAMEDMKKAGKETSDSQKQLGDAFNGTTFTVIKALEKRQQANDKASKLQAVTQANTEKLLVKSRDILTDENASIEQKKKALAEVTKAENSSAKEKLRIAQENLNIKKDEQKAYGETTNMGVKMNQDIRDATIARDQAETENAQTGIKLNRQRKMLGRQEVADAKANQAEITANNKARHDQDLLDLDENLKKEGLTFQQRRDLILEDASLTAKERKKLNDAVNADEQKATEEHKKAIADLNKRYDDEALNRGATTALEKEALNYSRKQKEIEDLKGTEDEKNALIIKLNAEHTANLDTINQEKKAKDNEDRLLGIQNEMDSDKITFEEKLRLIQERESILLQNTSLTENQKLKIKEDTASAEMQIEKLKGDQQASLLSKVSETLEKGADLLGKNTVAGKAMAVASALINTYQGITTELATKTVTPFEIGLKLANVAVIAGTGFKAVKSIMSVKVPAKGGGGGGGGGSVPSGISIPSPSAVNPNVVADSGTNQLANSISATPIKAYVVSKDMTTQQSLDRNITDTATIG